MLDLGALGLGLRDDVLVDGLDGSLEASELGHRVRDLPAPQRPDGLVESVDSLFSPNLLKKDEFNQIPFIFMTSQ